MYKVERYLWNNKIKIKNQRQVAKQLGMNECHISVIVNKKRTCPLKTAMAIAYVLGVKLEDIFDKVN